MIFAVSLQLSEALLLSFAISGATVARTSPKRRVSLHCSVFLFSCRAQLMRRVSELLGVLVFSAAVVRELLLTSGLEREQLATVWNVSDTDRDGALSIDEFCIACHVTRYIKSGAPIRGIGGNEAGVREEWCKFLRTPCLRQSIHSPWNLSLANFLPSLRAQIREVDPPTEWKERSENQALQWGFRI